MMAGLNGSNISLTRSSCNPHTDSHKKGKRMKIVWLLWLWKLSFKRKRNQLSVLCTHTQGIKTSVNLSIDQSLKKKCPGKFVFLPALPVSLELNPADHPAELSRAHGPWCRPFVSLHYRDYTHTERREKGTFIIMQDGGDHKARELCWMA